MNSKLLLYAITLGILTSGCATQSKRDSKPPTLEAQFRKADRNGDGKVSREEYGKLMIDEMAEYFDANGDGVVSKSEFVALGGSAESFDRLDSRGDGLLTAEEAKSSKEVVELLTVAFVGADINGDGYVTLEEAKAYREKARPYWN